MTNATLLSKKNDSLTVLNKQDEIQNKILTQALLNLEILYGKKIKSLKITKSTKTMFEIHFQD